jgi:signal transduction histidine kinase
MLEGLLDYAQAGDLASSGRRIPVRQGVVVAEVLSDLEAEIRRSGARIEEIGDVMMHAHPVLLRSVLANLLQNAIKYRSDRPLHIAIVGTTLPDGTPMMRVADNGIGIEPRHRERVLAMFERLSSHGEGIGLGLAMCHRIVSLHGGRLWIEDGLDGSGVAACFTVPETAP